MNLKWPILYIASFVPGLDVYRFGYTGGTDSARYCYSVWLRHLVWAKVNGLGTNPRVVAELGPGDSLGIGLSALISGAEKCLAFDVVQYANLERNLRVFDELVDLFKNRAAIPGSDEFPGVYPTLESYEFPHAILDEGRLRVALNESRVSRIRDSLQNSRDASSMLRYQVPWHDPSVIERESVDMIYSQAVLEHVDDLHNSYRAMHLWLKPTGFISHQIDFNCHGTAEEWNGHWVHSNFMWKLIKGNRPYLLNREPHSTHVAILKNQGFNVLCDKRVTTASKFSRHELAPRFRSMPEEDLTISGAFIQAVKATA